MEWVFVIVASLALAVVIGRYVQVMVLRYKVRRAEQRLDAIDKRYTDAVDRLSVLKSEVDELRVNLACELAQCADTALN
jgi:hypothetical protein